MYNKNDYRYYLEHQLMYSDDYLAHYGVIGMKWGVRHDERRASLMSKKDANNAKIANYQKKLNTVGAQKRAAKSAKYQHKVDKLQRKASKAQKRLAQGKSISKGQMKKLMKYENAKAKVAKNSAKNDKYQMKISKLQAKNAKLDKKITKMDRPSRAGARAYQKGLNNLDRKRAKYEVKAFDRDKTTGKQSAKGAKAERMRDKIVEEMNATSSDAKTRGYDVSSRSVKRHTGSYVIPTMQSGYMDGRKYSVKNRR